MMFVKNLVGTYNLLWAMIYNILKAVLLKDKAYQWSFYVNRIGVVCISTYFVKMSKNQE